MPERPPSSENPAYFNVAPANISHRHAVLMQGISHLRQGQAGTAALTQITFSAAARRRPDGRVDTAADLRLMHDMCKEMIDIRSLAGVIPLLENLVAGRQCAAPLKEAEAALKAYTPVIADIFDADFKLFTGLNSGNAGAVKRGKLNKIGAVFSRMSNASLDPVIGDARRDSYVMLSCSRAVMQSLLNGAFKRVGYCEDMIAALGNCTTAEKLVPLCDAMETILKPVLPSLEKPFQAARAAEAAARLAASLPVPRRY